MEKIAVKYFFFFRFCVAPYISYLISLSFSLHFVILILPTLSAVHKHKRSLQFLIIHCFSSIWFCNSRKVSSFLSITPDWNCCVNALVMIQVKKTIVSILFVIQELFSISILFISIFSIDYATLDWFVPDYYFSMNFIFYLELDSSWTRHTLLCLKCKSVEHFTK